MALTAGEATLTGGVLGGVIGLAGGAIESSQQRRLSKRVRRRARRATAAQVQQVLASPEVGRYRQFLGDIYAPPGAGAPGGAPDVLSQEFARGLRQAQSSRGLFTSEVGAGAEASGLAAFRARLQTELLPQLLGLGMLPSELESRFGQANILTQQGALAGTGSPFLGALKGFTTGFGGGAALGIEYGGLQQNNDPYMSNLDIQARAATRRRR